MFFFTNFTAILLPILNWMNSIKIMKKICCKFHHPCSIRERKKTHKKNAKFSNTTNQVDLHRNYTISLDQYNCLEYRIHIFVNQANRQPNNPYDDCVLKSTKSMDEMFVHRMVNWIIVMIYIGMINVASNLLIDLKVLRFVVNLLHKWYSVRMSRALGNHQR